MEGTGAFLGLCDEYFLVARESVPGVCAHIGPVEDRRDGDGNAEIVLDDRVMDAVAEAEESTMCVSGPGL